jgi:hypothetical protein
MERDIALCREYFGEHTVPTDIQRNRHNACYCLLQPKLDLINLTPEIVRSTPELREELETMVCANRRLLARQGVWLDMRGWNAKKAWGLAPYISNIAPTKNDGEARRLRLVDLGLVHPQGSAVMKLWCQIVLALQNSNLRRFGVRTRIA